MFLPLLLLWSLFQFFLPVYQSGTKESMQAYRHPVSSASLLLMGIQQLVYAPLYIWTYLALPHFHYIVGILIFQLACVGTLFAAALYVFGSPMGDSYWDTACTLRPPVRMAAQECKIRRRIPAFVK